MGLGVNRTLPIKDKNIIKQIKTYYRNRKMYRELLLFTLAINSGMKLVDLLNLNIKDVSVVLKTKSGVELALSDEIKDLISKVSKDRKPNEPLFISRQGNRLSRFGALLPFKEACKDLGLNYSVDSWRRTFGYHYYKKYHDLTFLQWYFNQRLVQETLDYIDAEDSIGARFRGSIEL
jgi:integrase